MPSRINEFNVAERASTLLDQYRKKSQLYGDKNNHNIVLIPLGDDFRYTDMQEAHDQFENYEKIIQHINSNEHYNAHIQFGTLKDYFTLLADLNKKNNKKIETFTGDFFTYADRQDHYWSGYFTSRPFSKRLERLVEGYLRSAEILFSLSNVISAQSSNSFDKINQLYQSLTVARKNLALFMHHDGITGTSKTPVVHDYNKKLFRSLSKCKEVIESCSSYLTSKNNGDENVYSIDDVSLANLDEEKKRLKATITFDNTKQQEEQKIVLFNSNLNIRNEIISVRVNSPNVEVLDAENQVMKNLQISLVWPNTEGGFLDINNNARMSLNENLGHGLDFDPVYFELLFQIELKPMSFQSYTIRKKLDDENHSNKASKVRFYQKSLNKDNVEKATTEIKKK